MPRISKKTIHTSIIALLFLLLLRSLLESTPNVIVSVIIPSTFIYPRFASKRWCNPEESQQYLPPVRTREAKSFLQLASENPKLCVGGGAWRPALCDPIQNLAVIIPYAHREENLKLLLERLHPLLQSQMIAYRIFVIEQADGVPFNRGALRNIGVLEALKLDNSIDCFILHDVDLIPEHNENFYLCDDNLRQLSSAIDENRYHVNFPYNTGGVISISKTNIFKINGYPNRYWGWGNEDDELGARALHYQLQVSRPPTWLGIYKAIRHVKDARGEVNNGNFLYYHNFLNEGLSSLNGSHYTVLFHSSFTRTYSPNLNIPLMEDNSPLGFKQLSPCIKRRLIYYLNSMHQSTVREQGGWTTSLENASSSILFTRIVVDLQPLYSKRTKSLQGLQSESLFWFLRFYGWI